MSEGLSQFLQCREKGRALEHSFPAAPSEGQGMSAAFTWGWLQSVKVGVQPGVPRAVLLSRVPAPWGAVCWGRDSATDQGKYSACLGNCNSRVGRSCGWKKHLTAGQGPVKLRSFPESVFSVS